jgi:non-ribosomal peptide synthetase-like protein
MPVPQGPRTVLDLFDAACARHGDGAALEVPSGDGRGRVTWTYRQLAERADRFRAAIAPHAAHDAVVVLAMARTDPRLYAAMLGAMRAGCAYCAIDPSSPDRQAADVVRDARARAIVGPAPRVRAIADAGGAATWIDPAAVCAIDGHSMVPGDMGADARTDAGTTRLVPDSLAYVIYTSGTTGKPKGVEVEHRSLLNLVAGDIGAFGLGARDRVAQGSSASYDSSVEEMWLAWAVGACAVVMDDATARLGPDLVDWLRNERITVLCPPPTLLRTLGLGDPARSLPHLRLVYVGGEALPEDVAARWSRGMRLENGYGPTECTVTCLRCTVHAGEPVTIGRPIPGTRAWVVDPDGADLPEVADGVHGELVIGGASLARGYRGQPDVTATRFVEHPTLGRVYRTGDLVHRDAGGTFHYHGRIDAQVKLRGHRVELGAVEARLAAQPGVLEAACAVQGIGAGQRLEAHVVMRAGATLDAAALRATLAQELPPALVPAAFAAIDAVPRTVGGKVDRRRLPAIAEARGAAPPHACPMTDTERLVATAIADVLGMHGAVHPDADFFDDLGLDSLTVAMAVSRLRTDPRTRAANVRMTYAHRTVRAAAAAIDGATGSRAPCEVHPRTDAAGHPMPVAVTCAQAAVLAALAVAGSQLLWMPGLARLAVRDGDVAAIDALMLACVAVLAVPAWAVATLTLAALAKWTIIGRYRPMRVRAWSWWHLRHWTVKRAASLVPWGLLETAGLAPAALRLLGARIGRNVHVHAGVRLTEGGWDLLTLEDGATIGQDASLRMVDLDAGCIEVAPITVRRNGTVETRAGMSGGAELGEGSVLRPLSNLVAGTVHSHSVLDGVPAVRVGDAPRLHVPDAPAPWFLRALVALALGLPSLAIAALPWALAVAWIGDRRHSPGIVVAAVAAAAASTVLLQGVLARLLGPPPDGRVSLHGVAVLRMAAQSALVESAGRWLSGTLMWPRWLRLAGARIGPGCEISTVTDVLPHAVTIGPETFFADGIYLGGPTLRAGSAVIDRIKLGPSCFVGNHAVLPGGTRLAAGTLVGISTSAELVADEPGSSWFGHPPFRLPRREVIEAPRELTHDPSAVRRVNRWCWELARFALPAVPVLVGVAWFDVLSGLEARLTTAEFRLVALPCMTVVSAAVLVAACIAIKWALVGRVRPGTHPLWSCWCSRWDFLYVAWGMWAAVPLSFLEGTLMLPAVLRLFGCRIGRRALLGPGFAHVVDPDMLRFGDGVTVQALMQAHTFEDRVLKIDHVVVRDGATVGANAVLLYGADVGERTSVAPHSVVMKRERLEPGVSYEGVPTQPAGGACASG